jgi:O-antigen ligase
MPYFLQGQVRNPLSMENEYARILSEQGIFGLLIWLGLIVWFLLHIRSAFAKGPWATTRRLVWCLVVIGLATALIGLGLLTSIPGTVFLVMGMGWTSVREAGSGLDARRKSVPSSRTLAYAPAVQ